MSGKKVLVVLDDVDNLKQLEFLVGTHEWFGPSSRIIITTRDEHLLSYAHEKYAPQLLNKTEATELFCRYAFKENIPPKDYEKLLSVVVSYTGHLPLALKVLGLHYFDRNLGFWQSALNVLTKIPHKEINGILKLSYNGLNDFEKKILLHIACFFKGWKRDYVTKILDCCGFEAVSGITVLIEKSLLTVLNGYLHMHDLIQQMGQCILSESCPHTMAWISKDIKEVMKKSARLKTVEAIWEAEHDDDSDRLAFCSAKVFKRMKKLRLLQIKGRFTINEPAYFPEEIRWLCWSNYPFKSMRITRGCLTPFRKKRGSVANLVGLELKFGELKSLRIQKKVIFTNLKFMDLCGCKITSSPDVSWVPNLERLILSRCWQLVEVHQSVLLHEKIIFLDLSSCESLKILPPYIHMKSLDSTSKKLRES
ncbi:TMV resistance protein N-like protein [Tanacetum coccineum]